MRERRLGLRKDEDDGSGIATMGYIRDQVGKRREKTSTIS